MPELPEVATVIKSLRPLVLGKTIKEVIVRYPKVIKNVAVETFQATLRGTTFRAIAQHGKYIIFTLDDYYLISHLRMEGKYFLKAPGQLEKHDLVEFVLTDGTALHYCDMRRFGTMHLFPLTADIYQLAPLKRIGPDPFSPAMSGAYLYEIGKHRALAIKSLLLDQQVMAGLGNIYVNEVLFYARIFPAQPARSLTRADYERIYEISKTVLSRAIALGGTTIDSFQAANEASGRFQAELAVHGQKQCPACGGVIDKIKVGGRGTYYCPHCQIAK